MIPFLSVTPMEPIPSAEIIADDGFIHQVKWDGVRMLAFVNPNEVRLLNRRQHERTGQYPEMKKLLDCVQAKSCILDGEIVVLKDQRPHFPSVMQRDNCRTASRITTLSRILPAHYMVFDLIQVDDEDMTRFPLAERRARLNQLLDMDRCPVCHLIDDFSNGSSLFKAVEEACLEGIVSKAADSLYHPARSHRAWYKTKCRQRIRCTVAGYTASRGRPRSLLLGIDLSGSLLYVGRAGAGLREEDWKVITSELKPWEVSANPFSNHPSLAGQVETHFVRPILGVEIEFQEWTDHLQLRSPVIREFFIIKKPGQDPVLSEIMIGPPGNGGWHG